MENLGTTLRTMFDSFILWLSASTANIFILLGIAVAAPTLLTLLWKALFGYHARMRREAKDIWRRIQKTASDRDVFILLRARYRAWHGSRYTGDGGIDGWVRFSHEKHPIQDKRYSGAINPQHVREFSRLCCSRGVTGLFIHTGTTGNASRDAAVNVRIISGRLLIDLVRKDCPFEL